jgi:glycosyltransferase involved in cell wall biosynthesis
MSVSVLVLTKNEERNIGDCLDSLGFSDDVLVFDSFSSDSTVEIAKSRGARVICHPFSDYGSQREAARRLGAFRHPWVLALDADERPDAELVREILQIAAEGSPHAAFRMRRKDHFLGRWIRRSSLYPSWFVRFYRHELLRYGPRAVHEVPQVLGSTGVLRGHLLHDNFSKGLAQWWERHARYAELEALERRAKSDALDWGGLFGRSDPMRRRRALKALASRLPFRPQLRFLYMYLLRGGCLDGLAGYHYCRMISFYEYLSCLSAKEQAWRGR